jgi:hypothetical protein
MNYLILAEGGFLDTIDILKQYGPFCGCLVLACAFSIWRDWKREEKMTKRINTLEDENRQVLLPLVRECTAVIARNTTVMERLEKHLNQ